MLKIYSKYLCLALCMAFSALAFAQTPAAGRLMGQEVLQFVNAGFNPLQIISEKTGRSMKDLKKDMENGAISADMVSEAFKIATSQGGLFFGALEKGSQTTSGKFAKLKDSFDQLKVAFGTGINEGLRAAYEKLGDVVPRFMETFRKAGKAIGTTVAEAVNGDSTKLEAIGFYIGTILKDGILSGLKATGEEIAVGLTKIAEEYGGAGILGQASKLADVSGTMESGKKGYSGFMQDNASKRQDMLRQIEMSSPETREINGQVFRKAFEGEKAQDGKFAYDENGQKLILIMDKVERNTRNSVNW